MLENTILIIDPGQKVISSSLGHELMNKNPFSKKRFEIEIIFIRLKVKKIK